ncbi:MAG: FAD-dependent oxidoreductase [Candidatus Methanomethylicaceae archaeon]|jgi:thioredoxin-disulfide reductase
MDNFYDVVIVGGGPAGMTAAVYCRRKLLRTIVITKDIGGQILLTANIENYLGYLGRSGLNLAEIFEQQVKEFETEILTAEVERIDKDGGIFNVKSSAGTFWARAVMVTGGSSYRRLNVPGEDRFFGHGVSTCATCDAPFARNRTVAVIGGGNAAFQSAELLCKYASKVYVLHRREGFRADEMLIDRVRKLPNVELALYALVTEIKGGSKVESIEYRDTRTGVVKELNVQMVFVEIGRETNLGYVRHLVKTNQTGQIVVDRNQRTSCEGLFAAGDITDLMYRQAIIAAGDGAVAALSAYDYLKEKG